MEFEAEATTVNFGRSIIVRSVQELTNETIINVPPRYVRTDQGPPSVTADTWLPPVPLIDLQKLVDDVHADELERLHSACREWGFFQVATRALILII